MTKRPKKRVERILELSENQRGGLADSAIDFDEKPSSYRLTAEQRAEVRLALKELNEGKVASQQELDALWRRAGLTV